MKRFLFNATAAILLCLMLVSCSKDTSKYVTNLLGLWVLMDINGTEALTDELFVLQFTSSGDEGYACIQDLGENNRKWEEGLFKYTLSGDEIRVTDKDGSGQVLSLKITSLDGSNLTYTCDGSKYKFRKITKTFSKALIGLWEGRNVTPGVDPNSKDGELHRWRYLEDGTYQYYFINSDGKWEVKEDNLGLYYIYGDLLATNWGTSDYVSGKEGVFSECWIIEIGQYEKDGPMVMNWEGRRANDKKVYFSMTKITE